jgi:hypothetical protein
MVPVTTDTAVTDAPKVKQAKSPAAQPIAIAMQKGLIISLDGGRPEFTFIGENWSGHNIMSVYGHLKRAYHLHNRTVRRGLTLKDLTLNEPSNQEGVTR